MDHQDQEVPMALVMAAVVEMLLRMSPSHETVSTPRYYKKMIFSLSTCFFHLLDTADC